MKKFIFILLIQILFLFLFSETVYFPIDESKSFNTILSSHSLDYFYHMDQSFPVIPSLKFKKVLDDDIQIDTIYFNVEKVERVKDAKIVSGENPLPKKIKPVKRSSLTKINDIYPVDEFKVFKSKVGGKTVISGFVSNFFYKDGAIYERKGKLVIEYKQKVGLKKSEKSLVKKILIITQDSLKTYWNGYANLHRDFIVEIKGVNEILDSYPSLSKSQAVREYIKDSYSTGSLRGVILGGDVDVIPPFYVQIIITPQLSAAEQTIPTDKFFSCLDGVVNFINDTLYDNADSIDILPDIFLGRVPVRNGNDVMNFLSKVEKFETLRNDTILFAASLLDNYTDGSIGVENFIKNIPVTNPSIKLYEKENNLSSFSFIENINKSPYFVFHDGHGNYSAIQTGTDYTNRNNFDTLKNIKPVFFYSLSCLSAAYDYDCMAEHFLLAPNGGGYYIGNSRYGWYTPYFPGFGTGDLYFYYFFKKLLNEYDNPSYCLNRTFEDLSPEIFLKNDWRWQFFGLNYFGDPLLSLKIKNDTSNLKIVNPVYKNGFLNFFLNIDDSSFVVIEGKSFTVDTFLYEDKNLICLRLDDSDSIHIHIENSSLQEFDTIIYPQDTLTKSIYFENYSFEGSSDTITLKLFLKTEHPDSFTISFLNIPDTILFFLTDTNMYILNDTTLSVNFLKINDLKNKTCIPVVMENETLYFQYGRNISENVRLNFTTEKQNYKNGDEVKYILKVENLAKDTLKIKIKDSIFSFPKGESQVAERFYLNNPSLIETLLLNLTTGVEKKDISYKLSINENGSIEDFENSPTLNVDSSTAFFHITTRRSLSGYYSLFSGYQTDETYPSKYMTSYYTDTFIFDSTRIFGFSTFVDIEPGMDYLVVKLVSDTFALPLATLASRNDSFRNYIFNGNDYKVLHNKKSYLKFSFYSEDDTIQYRGVYLDDVVLPGEIYQSNGLISRAEDKYENSKVYYHKGKIFVESFVDNGSLKIYNISGRKVFDKNIEKGLNSFKLNIPSGLYFINLKNFKENYYKKLFILR